MEQCWIGGEIGFDQDCFWALQHIDGDNAMLDLYTNLMNTEIAAEIA